MEKEDTTPAPEVTEPETTEETEQTVEEKEPTVSEQLGEKEAKTIDMVPIARLNKEIQRKKELERELNELRERAKEQDMSKDDITSDLKTLAEEHNIDAAFLDKLAKTIKAQAEADIDEKIRPITEREAVEKRERAFAEHFAKAIDGMPEFKDVVNADVIKQMAFNPKNADKTFRQLIEDAYGNALQGKRTIETATPRGGQKPGTLDIDRATRDTEYFREVMADPDLKKQYNESIERRVRL